MKPKSREPENPDARKCQGHPYYCRSTEDIRLDPTSRKWLCVECWARVDPAKYAPPEAK